jgi:hypothetical protein
MMQLTEWFVTLHETGSVFFTKPEQTLAAAPSVLGFNLKALPSYYADQRSSSSTEGPGEQTVG